MDVLEAPSELERVIAWREWELVRCGYPASIAAAFALRLYADDYVDLHVAIDLLAHGCTPELAERILKGAP